MVTIIYSDNENYKIIYKKHWATIGEIRIHNVTDANFSHSMTGNEKWNEGLNKYTFLSHFSPELKFSDLNNVINTINITLEFLVTSYTLLELEYDEVNKLIEEERDLYWYIYHFENTVARIITLDELLINLTNCALGMNHEENKQLRTYVFEKIKSNPKLLEVLEKHSYITREIRNKSFHNTKPFLLKKQVQELDGIIAYGRGKRSFNFLEDFPKIVKDVNYLILKYKDVIPELSLKFIKVEIE